MVHICTFSAVPLVTSTRVGDVVTFLVALAALSFSRLPPLTIELRKVSAGFPPTFELGGENEMVVVSTSLVGFEKTVDLLRDSVVGHEEEIRGSKICMLHPHSTIASIQVNVIRI